MEELVGVVLVGRDDPAEGVEGAQDGAGRVGVGAEGRVGAVDNCRDVTNNLINGSVNIMPVILTLQRVEQRSDQALLVGAAVQLQPCDELRTGGQRL